MVSIILYIWNKIILIIYNMHFLILYGTRCITYEEIYLFLLFLWIPLSVRSAHDKNLEPPNNVWLEVDILFNVMISYNIISLSLQKILKKNHFIQLSQTKSQMRLSQNYVLRINFLLCLFPCDESSKRKISRWCYSIKCLFLCICMKLQVQFHYAHFVLTMITRKWNFVFCIFTYINLQEFGNLL